MGSGTTEEVGAFAASFGEEIETPDQDETASANAQEHSENPKQKALQGK